jgi:uncharacterized integral membrane protein
MTVKSLTPQQKRLAGIRRILWIIYAGISIPMVLLLIPLVFLFNNSSARFVPGPDGVTPVDMFPILIAMPFLLVGFLAVVMIVIYQIFKYRQEKNEDLFL